MWLGWNPCGFALAQFSVGDVKVELAVFNIELNHVPVFHQRKRAADR